MSRWNWCRVAWQLFHLRENYCSWWWLCYMSKGTLWTSFCVAIPTSSAPCSWWWLCYMSKRTLQTSTCVVKPRSSVPCSWWLCYMSKRTLWAGTSVAKPTSGASCSWWWLCYMPKRTLWTSACVAKPTSKLKIHSRYPASNSTWQLFHLCVISIWARMQQREIKK